jgi:Chaperone of endosialidase
MALNGWIEIGLSNPNMFASQSNPDIVFRTYDPSASNKIIIGNTSSNEGNNRLGGMYIVNNNVGFKKVPLSGVDVDINGLYSTIDGRVASNLTVGYGNNPGFFQIRGDILMINTGSSDMRAINSNNTFYFMYSNIERIKFTNGSGMYLNDNVYITNDVYATGFHMTSDSNFKENIKEVHVNNKSNIDILSKLKVYDYTLKGYQQNIKGFIAQQVEEILPNAVKEIDNIIPVYKGFLRLNKNFLFSTSNEVSDFTRLFNPNDEIILGTNVHSKDYFITIEDVFDNYLVISQESFEKINKNNENTNNHYYVHGKVGKMKTIDTNQILALCVSSLQEIINKLQI